MNYIDLFSGSGGLSEGFIKNGFKAIAHIEMNGDAVNTLKTRLSYFYLKTTNKLEFYYQYLRGEITRNELYNMIPSELLNTVINEEMSEATLPKLFERINKTLSGDSVDIIVGGPPCQAYSLAGRNKQKRIQREQEKGVEVDDERKYLYKVYCDFLEYYKPKMFVFENVPGLLTSDGGKHWIDIKALFDKVGYDLQYKLLNSKEFGVSQERKRIIIIGWLKGTNYEYPKFEPTEASCTLKDLLNDLPSIQPGEESGEYSNVKPHKYVQKHYRNKEDVLTWHLSRPANNRDREIYRLAINEWVKDDNQKRLQYSNVPEHLRTHKNTKYFTDRFKIVPPNLKYSHTVLAHIAKDGHYYIHFDLNQARSLTVREAARLQSFPDNFYFEGSRTSVFTQIGNAVPPLMAEGIARELKKQLESKGGEVID
ncbi:DNA cytosine methyltransferase [Acholeplasma laidlawii]|uniref:DNA cytosine methyltransferase n=1 Tax=Acholeplasma laidlawii TaxID=2148 RepID=UPI0021F6F974|nr:DNA cytosine methyltransferase [Acholeplasma laidlawii]